MGISTFARTARVGFAALVVGTVVATTALPVELGSRASAASLSETTPSTSTPAAAPASVGASAVAVEAHRGGETDTPESTIAAFANSIKQGATGIVFDVRFTSDGVPVVLHDATLNRTTNCRGAVTKITAAKLAKCNANVGFPNFGFQGVPTMNQALQYITTHSSTVKLYIHTKTVDNAYQANSVLALMKRYHLDAGNRTTLLADNATLLRRLKKAGGHRLGLVFHDYDKKWAVSQTTYPVLYSWDATLTASDISTVAKQGRQLIASVGHPQTMAQLIALGARDLAVDNLNETIQKTRPAATPAATPAAAPAQQAQQAQPQAPAAAPEPAAQ